MTSSIRDLTGLKVGLLTVLAPHDKDNHGRWRWFAVCECGETTIAQSGNLTSSTTKSCGCLKKVIGRSVKDLTGKKFNRLTVIKRDMNKINNGKVYWVCKCDCGSTNSISSKHLQNGHTKSCGCLQIPMSDSALRARWSNIILDMYNHTCQKCGSTSEKLHAHHILSFTKYPAKKFNLDNGVSLCEACHKDFHAKYGVMRHSYSDLFDWIPNFKHKEPTGEALEAAKYLEFAIEHLDAKATQ